MVPFTRSRSVWTACGLPPLSPQPINSITRATSDLLIRPASDQKAGASSPHSKRFATSYARRHPHARSVWSSAVACHRFRTRSHARPTNPPHPSACCLPGSREFRAAECAPLRGIYPAGTCDGGKAQAIPHTVPLTIVPADSSPRTLPPSARGAGFIPQERAREAGRRPPHQGYFSISGVCHDRYRGKCHFSMFSSIFFMFSGDCFGG